jgi:hypothetical protein
MSITLSSRHFRILTSSGLYVLFLLSILFIRRTSWSLLIGLVFVILVCRGSFCFIFFLRTLTAMSLSFFSPDLAFLDCSLNCFLFSFTPLRVGFARSTAICTFNFHMLTVCILFLLERVLSHPSISHLCSSVVCLPTHNLHLGLAAHLMLKYPSFTTFLTYCIRTNFEIFFDHIPTTGSP